MTAPSSTEEAKASALLRVASLLALVGSLAALAVPTVLLLAADRHALGLSSGAHRLLPLEAAPVAVGAVLVVVALFLYRRAFSRLKHVDRRLRPASVLCLVGSLGGIVVVVFGAFLAGGSGAVAGCFGGATARALSCLRAADPAAGYLAIAGFWLVWLGAVGLAAGLLLTGRHFTSRPIAVGGALYAVLAADLVIPFLATTVAIPGTVYPLAAAPFVAVAAAVLVLVGARAGRRGD